MLVRYLLPNTFWGKTFLLLLLLTIFTALGLITTDTAIAEEAITEKKSPKKAHPPLKDRMPSANTCGECHPKHYKEWSGSQHAYAQLSPIFHTMQAATLSLTNGTNGDFCIRCHTPSGMDEGEPLFMDNTQRNQISRQGITCITCHRMNRRVGKVSGRLPIEQGKVNETVYGRR